MFYLIPVEGSPFGDMPGRQQGGPVEPDNSLAPAVGPDGVLRITVAPNAPMGPMGSYADRLAPFLPREAAPAPAPMPETAAPSTTAAQAYMAEPRPSYVGPATIDDNGYVAYKDPSGGLSYTDNTRHELRQDDQGAYHVYQKAPPSPWGAPPYVPPGQEVLEGTPAERAAYRTRVGAQPPGGRREGAFTGFAENLPEIAAGMIARPLPEATASPEEQAKWGFQTALGLVGPGTTLVPQNALGMAGSRMRRITPTTQSPQYAPPPMGHNRPPVTLTPHEGDPFPSWVGSAPHHMVESAPEDFGAAMAASKAAHKYGESLDDLPESFEGLRTHLSPDGQMGYAMTADGNIKYVFKHPGSPVKGAANAMLAHAIQNGGNRLDAFDGVLPDIYGRSGFRAVARLPFDERYAPRNWNYARDDHPDVVFMVHDPYHGAGYSKLDGVHVDTAEEGFQWQKHEADRIQARLKEGRKEFEELANRITGLKGVGRFQTPAEQELVTSRNVDALMRVFTNLPFSKEEMAAIAYSARAKRGWYRQSAQALVDIFGAKDAPRFTALLAALSPQTSVESNAENALRVWTAWKKAGEPRSTQEINAILEKNVQQQPDKLPGESSVLPAWRPNALRALMTRDPQALEISGPKVNSFMANLRNAVHEVTNDAWMANYGNIDQELFQGRRPKALTDPYGTFGVKSPGYLAMSARVRQAADVLSRRTGEVWTPAEIQETVWSWAKTLFEKAYKTKGGPKDMTVEKLLNAGNITHEEIANTPDFARLFTTNVYRKILEQGGYGKELEQIAARGGRGGGATSLAGTPLTAQGSGVAQSTFTQHLRAAARRLDERRAQQLATGVPVESE